MSWLRKAGLSLRLLAAVVLVATLASSAWAKKSDKPSKKPHTSSSVAFAQLDWHAVDGVTIAFDTLWGAFDYQYGQVRGQTEFLNLFVVAPGGDSAWVIRNLPLFPEKGRRREPIVARAFFDLSELGIAAGEPLVSLCYATTIDRTLRRQPPGPVSTCVDVPSEDYIAGDAPTFALPGLFDPGAPFPMKFDDEPKKLGDKRKNSFNGVQEGDKQCMAGAIARSLDWLNRERKLGSNKTAQDFYKDLVAAGVTLDGPGGAPKVEGDRVANKQKYVAEEFDGRIVTKTWDPGNDINTPKGVKESREDFAVWLKREWETEDVELAFKGPNFAHIVTLTEVAEDKNGNFKVKYRDDENQGVDNGDKRGDTKEKDGQVFKKDGKWYFGNTSFPLDLAISESVKKKKKTQTSSTSTSTSTTFAPPSTTLPATTSTLSATTSTTPPATTTTTVTTSTTLSATTTTPATTSTTLPAETTTTSPTTTTTTLSPGTTLPPT